MAAAKHSDCTKEWQKLKEALKDPLPAVKHSPSTETVNDDAEKKHKN